MSRKSRTSKDFLSYILKTPKDTNNCLIFYSSIRIKGKSVSTKRFMYESVIGPIPEHMHISRRCGVKNCCNPEHLFLRKPGDITNLSCSNRKTPEDKIEEIKKLRESQKTIKQISDISGISESTVHKYIAGMPLDPCTLKRIRNISAKNRGQKIVEKRKALWEGHNKFSDVLTREPYSKKTKGHIAEASIMYRLLIHNFSVYSSVFDGEDIDMIARSRSTKKLIKIQVRCVKRSKKGSGTPAVSVMHMKGRYSSITYTNNDLDFLVGYDIYTDTAYVFSWDEIKNIKAVISCTFDSKENWKKLSEYAIAAQSL